MITFPGNAKISSKSVNTFHDPNVVTHFIGTIAKKPSTPFPTLTPLLNYQTNVQIQEYYPERQNPGSIKQDGNLNAVRPQGHY